MGEGTNHAMWLRAILRAEQERRGWSYEQLARAVARELDVEKVSRQTVYQWASFESHPKIDQFAAWARALDYRLEVDLVRADADIVVIRVPPAVADVARQLVRLSAIAFQAVATLVDLLAPKLRDDDREE